MEIHGREFLVWCNYIILSLISQISNLILFSGWGFSVVYRCKKLNDFIDQIYRNVEIQCQDAVFEIYGCTIQRIVKIKVNPPDHFEDIRPVEKGEPPVAEDEICGKYFVLNHEIV